MGPVISRLRDHGPECLWFVLLALVVTWPMPVSPMEVIVGHEQATSGCHVWVLWWAQQHRQQAREAQAVPKGMKSAWRHAAAQTASSAFG